MAIDCAAYVFFGSASVLADRLRESLNESSRPVCLLLDFANVSGFDFSAVNVLSRVVQAAASAGVRVVISGSSEPFKVGLARNLPESVFAQLDLEADADRALERCEEIVIEAWRAKVDDTEGQRAALLEQSADDLERFLDHQIDFEDLMAELGGWLEGRDFSLGEQIAGTQTTQAGLQLLVSGRASAYDAAGARLYQCAPGDAVWPAGAPDERVASVVAEEPCRTVVLMPATRHYLETNRPDLVLKLYRYLLAERFPTKTNDVQ